VTAILFDERTGRLQLDQATFDCLAAWAHGHGEPGPELSALRDAGVVRPQGPHPALAPGLQAVTEPVCRLRLRLTDEAMRLKSGEAWVAAGAAALLLDLPDGPRDFLTMPPDFLPAAIARVVRLGPRPRAGAEPVNVAADLLEDIPSSDPARRRGAVNRLAAMLVSSTGGRFARPSRIWHAQMTWSSPGDTLTRRTLYVLDNEAGMFLAEFEGRRATLWPTTPTAVWRLLIRLLPDSQDLA